jgi:hypothetical protein
MTVELKNLSKLPLGLGRNFDIVAAWSVSRLGRSLPGLIGLLGCKHRAIPGNQGRCVSDTARLLNVSPAKMSVVRRPRSR